MTTKDFAKNDPLAKEAGEALIKAAEEYRHCLNRLYVDGGDYLSFDEFHKISHALLDVEDVIKMTKEYLAFPEKVES